MLTEETILRNEIMQAHLEKLEAMIDIEHIERTELLQKKTFNFGQVDHIPTVINYPVDENEWPSFGYEEIFNDLAKMLLSELRSVYLGAKLQVLRYW